jgi:hypothetical protein
MSKYEYYVPNELNLQELSEWEKEEWKLYASNNDYNRIIIKLYVRVGLGYYKVTHGKTEAIGCQTYLREQAVEYFNSCLPIRRRPKQD